MKISPSPYLQTPSVTNNLSINQNQKDKALFKLKDDHKIIIFYITKQSSRKK